MKILRTVLFNSLLISLTISLNTFISHIIDVIYLYSFWSCLCIWILSESHIIIMDMKALENKYKDLNNRYLILLKDYNKINKKLDNLSLVCSCKLPNFKDDNIYKRRLAIIDSKSCEF